MMPLKLACEATMFTCDNTAANIVIQAVGGPDKITAFLRQSGDTVTQLDRLEPALNEATPGDIRDTTTPNAMTQTLNTLLFEDGLSKDSQQQLIDWQAGTKLLVTCYVQYYRKAGPSQTILVRAVTGPEVSPLGWKRLS